ncbi:hypothetical protein GYMLUDRAFT_247618 [Collybiopsis luxurians FD-317 M1]|uniref:Uncharacterized protein n=1 Tax=Collybiopsis luxurians FD-317 M1 TaxID=944289 RepID=A0A0D0BNM6_9AGAR|nr:hypothetical protein GYMLUDRAFT_247618 [Collybiopsis luxurians FD-317 M1]
MFDRTALWWTKASLSLTQRLGGKKNCQPVQDNYGHAVSTFNSAWTESQMCMEKGYMRNDAQVKRDELVRTPLYFVWPDTRLQAYLREHSRFASASSRQTCVLPKFRSNQIGATSTAANRMINGIKEIVNNNVLSPVEEQLNRVWEVLVGTKKGTEQYAGEKYIQGDDYVYKKAKDTTNLYGEKKTKAYEKVKGGNLKKLTNI